MKDAIVMISTGLYLGGIIASCQVTHRIAPHQPVKWHLLKAFKWPIDDPFQN